MKLRRKAKLERFSHALRGRPLAESPSSALRAPSPRGEKEDIGLSPAGEGWDEGTARVQPNRKAL
jgi:hypothetical protein